MIRMTLALPLVLLACAPDDAGDTTAATATSTTDATTLDPPQPDPQGLDSTGGAPEAGCIDDYHGNQTSLTALPLGLDTTDDAVVSLGDGYAATPTELGSDALAVCASTPADFFVLQAECASYLSIEVRALEGDVPELLLHDHAGQLVEQSFGDWYDFFLKPVHRHVEAGTHVIEVQHAGGGAQRYSLTVILLPGVTCGA